MIICHNHDNKTSLRFEVEGYDAPRQYADFALVADFALMADFELVADFASGA